MQEPTTHLGLRISNKLHSLLCKQALKEGEASISAIVRKAIGEYLKRKK